MNKRNTRKMIKNARMTIVTYEDRKTVFRAVCDLTEISVSQAINALMEKFNRDKTEELGRDTVNEYIRNNLLPSGEGGQNNSEQVV